MRIIVTGLIAQHPTLGGVAWDYVQYPVGLSRLGHDVYYFEDSGEWPYRADGGPSGTDWVARDCAENVGHLARVMGQFGLEGRWAYRFPIDGDWFGLSDSKRREVTETADLVINVSGTLEHPARYRHRGLLVYVDSDPVFTQVKYQVDESMRNRIDAHDVFFSFGEAFSEATPVTPHQWLPTRQPVLLDEWDTDDTPPRDCFTTVMSWTSYKPLELRGCRYAQKDVEFSKFLDLPRRVPTATLEVALGDTRHVDWEGKSPESGGGVRGRLSRSGWRVADAMDTCGTLNDYRRYIASSKAEWSVAKNGYVVGRPGWFSCRSACYLASGRPVAVQETGFSEVLPVGDGILPFSNLDEAVTAVEEIEIRYEHHQKAARELAAGYFSAEVVLERLVGDALNAATRSTIAEAGRETDEVGVRPDE